MNVAFQDAVEKCPETGLVAVKTGADVGDDFRATGPLESFCLPKQVFFLIVGRNAGITKVLALDTACHRIQLQIESTVTAKRAAGYDKKAFLSPTTLSELVSSFSKFNVAMEPFMGDWVDF